MAANEKASEGGARVAPPGTRFWHHPWQGGGGAAPDGTFTYLPCTHFAEGNMDHIEIFDPRKGYSSTSNLFKMRTWFHNLQKK